MTYNELVREAAQGRPAERYQVWQQEVAARGFVLHADVPSLHIDQFEDRLTGKTIYIARDAAGNGQICHPQPTNR